MKKKLYVSNEIVRLIGYGNTTAFYGWIVISRCDVLTSGLYGRERSVLFEGIIKGTTTTGPTTCTYNYFTNSYYTNKQNLVTVQPLICYRLSQGNYEVLIPTPFNDRLGSFIVLLTGMGKSSIAKQPVKTTLLNRSGDSFTVGLTDNTGYCDGDFYFQVISTRDWDLQH